jgi:dihydroorotase
MNTVDKISSPRWLDRHSHLREGQMLNLVLPHTLASKAMGAVAMPNLQPPVADASYALQYIKEVSNVIDKTLVGFGTFQTIRTLYLADTITPKQVLQGFRMGYWQAVKLYLAGSGGTTNSSSGVQNLEGRYPIFEMMEREGIPLLGHWEWPNDMFHSMNVLNSEREVIAFEHLFLPIVTRFPNLRIVFEHVSDCRVAEWIPKGRYQVFGTVTPHHLLADSSMGKRDKKNGLGSLWKCMPCLKSAENRRRLCEIITNDRNGRFGAGTDSAPHTIQAKREKNASGLFTAPCAVQAYATIFDRYDALDERFTDFMSRNFLHIYGLEPSRETMTLVRQPFRVPETVGSGELTVPVFWGGRELPWSIEE